MRSEQGEERTPRILFVDDEANVLEGLRRMLRGKRREWDMTFVTSGEEALQAVDQGGVDIIVSDLRMPGLDGVALLKEVRKRSPETVRVALSGYADRDETLRAVTQIHQFLSKPCEPDLIKYRLGRAVELSTLLTDRRLREVVSQMHALPSLTRLFDDVLDKVENEATSLAEIGDLIARDPGLSGKVIQLVNSAFFGIPNLVADPTQATVLLGLDAIRTLIISIKMYEALEEQAPDPEFVAETWDHCVLVARLAKRIALAEAADEETAEEAFLSGLLHDTGKLVYATNMPLRYRSVVRLGKGNDLATNNAERNIIGADHGHVAAYLVALWGFSTDIIEAIALHHTPSESATSHFTPLTAVHAANVLTRRRDPDADETQNDFDSEYLERLGLMDRIPLWDEMYVSYKKKAGH